MQELVQVRVPERYANFYSTRGPGKPEARYAGGQIAEVTPREAGIYGLEVLKAPVTQEPGAVEAPATRGQRQKRGDA